MSLYNGYLNVYKEKGMTSHDVVFQCRKILKTKKIGHTGTLDPNAEGVLVLCVGKATKMVEYLTKHEKTYEAEIIFGKETDTCDLSGKTLYEEISQVSEDQFKEALKNFIGSIMQRPPIYSAVKINGKKLYQYARNGENIDIPERSVTITKIFPIEFSEKNQQGKILVTCSKGTYIRSLCRDIGQSLKTYSCMGNLLRHQVGAFLLEDALKISEIKKKAELEILDACFYAPEFSMDAYALAKATEQGKKFLANGNKLYQWNVVQDFNQYKNTEMIRLYSECDFVGMGRFYLKEENEESYIKPVKLL